MSSTTAREPRNDKKRTDEAILETDAQFIQGLKVFSGDSESVSGLAGGNAQNSPKAPAGNYLAREGDSMIGPIAFGPPVNFRVQIGTAENINISNLGDSPQYSSNIELDSVQPNGFVLTNIEGANFDGQLLIMRTFGPDSFTLTQMTVGNGGNIQTPEDEDFIFEALQMVILIYDDALLNQAATGGTWRLLTSAGTGGGAAGTGTYTSVKMDQDQVSNLALNDHFQFNQYVEDGLIVLQGLTPTFDQTSGIFELKAGKTYYLYGDATAEFNGVNDTAKIAWWDRTNNVQLGQKGSSFPFSNSTRVSTKHSAQTIFTPATDVNVDLRITDLVGTITTVFASDTQANIFEFSGKNGEPGPSGSTAWKTPARAKTLVDVPNLAVFNVIVDGVTLVQGDRVLLTEQVTQSENGLWEVGVVGAGFAPLTRPSDFDTDAEVISETFVAIEEGNKTNNQLWHLISNNPLTIDVSTQVWEQFAPGTSGGPDLGGGEDGIDGAGEFVNDGRVGIAFDRLKRIQQLAKIRGPTYSINTSIYMHNRQAGINVANLPGRILWCGRMDQAASPNASYTDNYGEAQVDSTGLNNGYEYKLLAYDDAAEVLVIMGDKLTGGGGPLGAQVIHRSTDKGANFVSTAFAGNDGIEFEDLKWIPQLSLFVALKTAVNSTSLIWTSPDGNTWTNRVNPLGVPNPPSINSFYAQLEYSPSLGKIYVVGPNLLTAISSVDGINWVNETSVPYTGNTRKMIWSEGQQKFVMLRNTSSPSVSSTLISPDGKVWEAQAPFPNLTGLNVLNGVYDLVWCPDLSLWLGIGTGDVNVQIFWASHDATSGSWYNMPIYQMRRQSFFIGDSGFSHRPRTLVYVDDFGYFCGIGGEQRTAGSPTPLFEDNVFFRTEVYFNGALGPT